jgi:hypothetical protein
MDSVALGSFGLQVWASFSLLGEPSILASLPTSSGVYVILPSLPTSSPSAL